MQSSVFLTCSFFRTVIEENNLTTPAKRITIQHMIEKEQISFKKQIERDFQSPGRTLISLLGVPCKDDFKEAQYMSSDTKSY